MTVRVLALSLLLFTGQEAPSRKESWSEWFTIASKISPSYGWIRSPMALEYDVNDPIPEFFVPEHPVQNGRLIVRRGAVLECWDLAAKRQLWKLPSKTGFLGWTLHYGRVLTVLPEGPAARAGVVPGDLIVAMREKPTGRNNGIHPDCRAGDKIIFDLTSIGGSRRVTLTAEEAPEPFGDPPRFEVLLGENLLITRDGFVELLRADSGAIEWSVRGGFLCAGSGGVLLEGEDQTLRSISPATGATLWERRFDSQVYVGKARWTDQGFLVLGRSYAWTLDMLGLHRDEDDWDFRDVRSRTSGYILERLDAATGKSAWSFTMQRQGRATLELLPGGRVFLTSKDDDCSEGNCLGGLPVHAGPTCITYRVLDLKSGEVLWTRRTGGRVHGGGDRHEWPEPIRFDPLHGGPGAIQSDRLLWFDLEEEDLHVIDPGSLRDERVFRIPGAKSFRKPSPAGLIGMIDSAGVKWLDPRSGEVHGVPGSADATNSARPIALEFARDDRGNLAELRVYDCGGFSPKLAWKRELPSDYWYSSLHAGDRLLVRTCGSEEITSYALLEIATGKELWTERIANPYFQQSRYSGRQIWGEALADRYLFIMTSAGIRVYRRDDAPHHD